MVSDRLLMGRAVTPALTLTDVSSVRSGIPNAFVTRLWFVLVRTLRGSRVAPTGTNCVLTLLNHTCWSEGARKPELTAARSATRGAIS